MNLLKILIVLSTTSNVHFVVHCYQVIHAVTSSYQIPGKGKSYFRITIPKKQFQPFTIQPVFSKIRCSLLCLKDTSSRCASFAVTINENNILECKLGNFIQNQTFVSNGDSITVYREEGILIEILLMLCLHHIALGSKFLQD